MEFKLKFSGSFAKSNVIAVLTKENTSTNEKEVIATYECNENESKSDFIERASYNAVLDAHMMKEDWLTIYPWKSKSYEYKPIEDSNVEKTEKKPKQKKMQFSRFQINSINFLHQVDEAEDQIVEYEEIYSNSDEIETVQKAIKIRDLNLRTKLGREIQSYILDRGLKICAHYKKAFKTEDFARDKHTKDGFWVYCRKAESERQKAKQIAAVLKKEGK